MKREIIQTSDFAKEIYGSSLDEILDEHAILLSQYCEFALKEITKSVNNTLSDIIPSAYLE